MLATHYYILVALAGALTAAWLFRPRERTQVTAFGALLSWGLAAVLGGAVEIYDGTNETIVGNVTDGTNVEIGSPREKLSSSSASVNTTMYAGLTAGDTYEIQVTDTDSGFSVGSGQTFAVIESLINQP